MAQSRKARGKRRQVRRIIKLKDNRREREKAPSGIYFYELKAENHFHKVKKMTLLK